MFYVYFLKSSKNGKHYTGVTSKNPKERLVEHNEGSNIFTRYNGPFELIYSEQYLDKTFAYKREGYLKTGKGRNFLKKFIPL